MPMTEQTRAALELASTATLHTQLFKRGLRNTFLPRVHALNPGAANFVAHAFTLRYIPAREDIDTLRVFDDPDNPQRKAVEAVTPGEALVVDARGDATAASAGHILLTRLLARGVAAFVTDGSVRDSPRIRSLGLPTYVAGVSAAVSLARHHAVDLQVPIACAGVGVYPGDVLVGDREGVIVIPAELAEDVAHDAADQEALEEYLLARVEAGAHLTGTYPPNAEVLAAYRALGGRHSPADVRRW